MENEDGLGPLRGVLGFLERLALLFIGLRLAGFIDWPWWLVLMPLYGPFATLLGFAVVTAALMAAAGGGHE